MKITKRTYSREEIQGNKNKKQAGLLQQGYNEETGEGYFYLDDGKQLALIRDDETGMIYPFVSETNRDAYTFKSYVFASGETLYFVDKGNVTANKKLENGDVSISLEDLEAAVGGQKNAVQVLKSLADGHLAKANKDEVVYARVQNYVAPVAEPVQVLSEEEQYASVFPEEKTDEEVADNAFGYIAVKLREAICAKYGMQTEETVQLLQNLYHIDTLIDERAAKNPSLPKASAMTEAQKEAYRERRIRKEAEKFVAAGLTQFRNSIENIDDKDKELVSNDTLAYLTDMAQSFIEQEIVMIESAEKNSAKAEQELREKEQEALRISFNQAITTAFEKEVNEGKFDFQDLQTPIEMTKPIVKGDKEYRAKLTDQEYKDALKQKDKLAGFIARHRVDELLDDGLIEGIEVNEEVKASLYANAQETLLNIVLPEKERADLFTMKMEEKLSKEQAERVQKEIAKEVEKLKPLVKALSDKQKYKKAPEQLDMDRCRIIGLADEWARKFVKDPKNGYMKVAQEKKKAGEAGTLAALNQEAKLLTSHVLSLTGGNFKFKKQYKAAKAVLKTVGKVTTIGLATVVGAAGIAGAVATFIPNNGALEDAHNQGRVYAEGFKQEGDGHIVVKVNEKETPVAVKISGFENLDIGAQKFDRAIHVGAALEGINKTYTNAQQISAVSKLAQIVANEAVEDGIVVGYFDRNSGKNVVSTVYPLDGEYTISGNVEDVQPTQQFVDKLISQGISTSQAQTLADVYDMSFAGCVGDRYLTKLYEKEDGKGNDGGDDEPVKPQDEFEFEKFDYDAFAGTDVNFSAATDDGNVLVRDAENGDAIVLDFAEDISSYKTAPQAKDLVGKTTYIDAKAYMETFYSPSDVSTIYGLAGIDSDKELVGFTPDSYKQTTNKYGKLAVKVEGAIITENEDGTVHVENKNFGETAIKNGDLDIDYAIATTVVGKLAAENNIPFIPNKDEYVYQDTENAHIETEDGKDKEDGKDGDEIVF